MRQAPVFCGSALFLLLLCFAFKAHSQEYSPTSLQLTAKEKQWLTEHPVIRVHNEKEWPPFNFYKNGQPQGFSVDYMNLLAAKLNLTISYQSGPELDEFLDRMKNRQLDVMLNIIRTSERDNFMLFSKPYCTNPNVIISNQKNKIENLKQLEGRTVAVPRGFFYERLLKDTIPHVKLLQVDNILEALKAVAFNQADATLQKEAIANSLIASNMLMSLRISSAREINDSDLEGQRIAIRNDWPIFKTILDKTIASVTEEELKPLQKKWLQFLENVSPKLHLTREESQWLKTHKTFTLGIDPDRSPIEGIDRKGNHIGLASDILSIIADQLNISFEPVKGISWPGVLMGLNNGIIDVAAAVPSTPARAAYMNFTDSYISLPLMIFTRTDHPYIATLNELNNAVVAVMNDYAVVEYLERDLPHLSILKVDSTDDGLNAIISNKADCYIDTLLTTSYQLQQHGYDTIKVAGETPYTYQICLAVTKAAPQLYSILQKALASISNQERNALFSKWRSIRYEHQVDYSQLWKFAGAGLLVVFGFAHWNRKLRLEISERKKTTKQLQENEKKTRAMSEAVHDGLVMIDGESKVMYWNSAATNLFGISADDAIGQNLHSLLIPEQHWDKARKGLKHFAKTGQGPVVNKLLELDAQRKDGTSFPVEVGVSSFQIDSDWYAVGTIRDITERNKTEKIVTAIRSELQMIFDNAQVGILYLKDDHILYRCNNRLADLLGYESPKAMQGLTMSEFLLSEEKNTEFGSVFFDKLKSGQLIQIEYELKKKDGSGIWCYLNGKAIDEKVPADLDQGVILVLEDITETRDAKLKLEESEKKVKTILNSIHTGTIIIDPETFTILDINPIAAKMINLPPEDIIQRKCFEFICPNKEGLCPVIHQNQQINDTEQLLVTGDQKKIPVLKTISTISLNDKDLLLESFVDLTQQKNVERELQENLKELERFYKMAVDREVKMIALKAEINVLLKDMGRTEKYIIR